MTNKVMIIDDNETNVKQLVLRTKVQNLDIIPATVDLAGKVHIPVGHVATSKTNKIEVTATSVYDNTKTGTASITVL